MKKFAVSLFIDFEASLKTYIVLSKSIDDIKTEGDYPTTKLMKSLSLDYDPESIYVDAVSIESDDMPSPYIIK